MAGVLGLFGFCGMFFFLRESLEKSLVVGGVGATIGGFRYAMRGMVRGPR